MRALLAVVLALPLLSACMPDTDQRPPEMTSGDDLGEGRDDTLLIDSDGRIDDDDPM